MKWLIALLVGALCFVIPADTPRTPGRFGGTFIGVIVTKEGIVVGSDSRSTFVTSAGKPVGYVDRMPKIYVNHGRRNTRNARGRGGEGDGPPQAATFLLTLARFLHNARRRRARCARRLTPAIFHRLAWHVRLPRVV